MNDFPLKINNSYESGSNSSSTGSSTTDQVLQCDDMENPNLAAFLATAEELYNTSAEEGIFPNVMHRLPINVPSYMPSHYDYDINDYSNAPLIYSWLPIVSGFTENGVGNLDKFNYSDGKLNVSGSSDGSTSISNQNVKYHDHLVINSSADTSKLDFRDLDNSCNAMDLNISRNVEADETPADPNISFDGKIAELKAAETEEERLHNESFEVLKKEDSSKMLYINERSPDLFEAEETDVPSDNADAPSDNERREEVPIDNRALTGACDSSILKKLRTSLAGLCPPPSVTRFQLSLTEMLDAYNNNVGKTPPPESAVKSSSFFLPTHTTAEVTDMEWPRLMKVKCQDVAYNKSTDNEHIEELCGRYAERYIGAETTTSFNFKSSASSAKKRIERLKLQTQSPGRRLSHLAKRRTVFSSANLKSSGLAASQSSSGGHLMIDKKLLAKASKAKSPKKRTSAKKKTPGKRKTPRSAKRQAVAAAHPEPSRVSSKRALFTSPLDTKQSTSLSISNAPKEMQQRANLPRRTLFSPEEQKKRKRSTSPDQDAENRFGKQRRMQSPTRMPKSQSFSMAPTTSSTGESFRKQLFQRTQSEVAIPGSSGNRGKLGYTEHPLPSVVKKKILWSVSNALTSKKVSNEHEKFKEFASILTRLVKNIFIEFYNPAIKSISDQLMKIANQMVFYVIQGQDYAEIHKMTRLSLLAKNSTKVSGYVSQQDYDRRRSSSLLLLSQSCSSSLNLSDNSLNSSRLSNSSLNRSTSKNNESIALRENFMSQSSEKSARKFGGSDSNINLNRPPSAATTPSTNLMKAKRQISF